MQSKRGAENIRKFNNERREKYYALIEHELKLCRKRKLQFTNYGHLAAHLSDRTTIHRTTLVRNAKYKALIAVYMRSQPGAISVVDDHTDDPWILKSKLATTQAEVGMLRSQVRKLSAQVSRKLAEPRADGQEKSGVAFSNLCVLLCMVLSRADTFAIDAKKNALIDLASRPSERIVGGPDRASSFIAWIARNQDLPFVNAIKRV
jgi:hypothetical protein